MVNDSIEQLAAEAYSSINAAAAYGKGAPETVPSYNFYVTLNGPMAKYGPDIRRFVDAMVYKLEKNVHKGRWEDLSMPGAFDRLQAEVKELLAEVNSDRNTIKVTLEAADVANFALIIAAMAIEGRK